LIFFIFSFHEGHHTDFSFYYQRLRIPNSITLPFKLKFGSVSLKLEDL